jgi:cytochrome c biogenesis protein CcmG/thiol:disulfide interchange protein DsbE
MAKRRLPILALVPALIFALLAGVFAMQLVSGRDTSELPTALMDRRAPDFELPPLDGLATQAFTSATLADGKATLVNIWASWCAPCRAEHPVLMALAKRDDLQIAGINYKDQPGNARRFLGALGNPFDLIGVDPAGRASIDWGFYGVPETFLVDGRGIIRHKIVGPITAAKYEELLTILDQLPEPTS